jgi:hypothetical protein
MAEILAELRITGMAGNDTVNFAQIVQDFQRLVEVMNRRYVRPDGGMVVNWRMEEPLSGFIFNINFNIAISADDIVTLFFDGGSGPIIKTLPNNNNGAVITDITAVTGSGTPYLTPITIGGTDAGLFELTNGGVCPCELIVGPIDLAIGSHIGIWTFTAPFGG